MSYSGLTVAIVVPAFNEESSIKATLEDFATYFPGAIFLVIDNNSSDGTFHAAKDFLFENNLDHHVLFEKIQGKSNAVKLAFSRVKADIWVMADADNTYPAKTLSALVEKMLDERFAHGIADRMSEGSYLNSGGVRTKIHNLGNTFFTKLISVAAATSFKDVLSGGRVFSAPFVETLVIESKGFQLETELNFHSSDVSAQVCELPTEYRTRPSDNPSKLSTIRDGLRILGFIFRWSFFRKSDYTFFCVAFVLLVAGLILGSRLVSYFWYAGNMPYASTAVLVGVLITGSLLFATVGITVRQFRKSFQSIQRRKFQTLTRVWNERLDKLRV